MLQKRHALRSDPNVVAAARQWWRFMPKATSSSRSLAASADGGVDGVDAAVPGGGSSIDKPAYCAMVVVVQMVGRGGRRGRER